ncbi:MAG: DUF3127 domain-containing protein [Siphonobacter sp.]
MALEIEGTLQQIMPVESGTSKTGNSWQKQNFVIETQEQYPKKVCFSLFGDKVSDLQRFTTGDQVKVSFNLESREFNSRWYTDARAWRIELMDSNSFAGNGPGEIPPSPLLSVDNGSDDLPF